MKKTWSSYVHAGPETAKTSNEKYEKTLKEQREAPESNALKKMDKMFHKIHQS